MKNLLTVVASMLLLVLLLIGCKKDSWSYCIEAQMNGEDWEGDILHGNPKYNPVSAAMITTKVYDGDIERESLSFQFLPLTEGKHYINPSIGLTLDSVSAIYATIKADGDAIGTHYQPSGDSTDYINVLHYDAASGEIEGTFHIRFVHDGDPIYIYPGDPEEVLFEDGHFKTVIDL